MATPDFIKAPIALITNFILPHPSAKQVDLAGKTILVTGATPGSIGFETARTLALWGATVIATARSEQSVEKSKQAFLNEGVKIDLFSLDLANANSVKHFAELIEKKYSSLDVLINNAGIYLDVLGKWKQQQLSDDGFEIHWRTNYLGSVQLTLTLLPLLEHAAQQHSEARVINVSSHMHDNCSNEEMFSGLLPYKSVKAYGRSKLAINHFTFFAHEQFQDKAIKFICLHPGSIYTNLVEKGLQDHPALLSMRSKLSFIEKMILLNPVQGAQTQIMCASSSVVSGQYYRRCKIEIPSKTLDDREARQKLWQLTQEQLTQIK